MKRTLLLILLFLCCSALGLLAGSNRLAPQPVAAAAPDQHMAMASPAHGYDVHVTAPHLVDGKEHGPYHHYCKVHAPDPQIVCLIYESTDSNAVLAQIEWIYAKQMTRNSVPLRTWNRNWHDHAIEIAGGRVKVHDLPDDKAKEVADLVATTDGLIYHFYRNDKLPNSRMSIAQAVGHKPMTLAEFKNYAAKK